MIAAQLLGYEQIGLAALIERFFAVTIPKSGQKSDWSRRPLSDKQLRYAVNDTSFLERLADRMRCELAALGRLEWHNESCQAMVEATGRDAPRDPENAWRLKGAGRLTDRQLAYLRELWLWRDELARSANLPAFRVLGNHELLELVHWADSHPGAPLELGPKLPRNITGARLATLTDAIARATAMGASEWPQLRKHERELPRNDCIEEIDALRSQCAQRAQELAIAPSTLAPKAALEAIARGRPQTLEEIMACGGLLHWQAEIVQPVVEECLFARRQ
jgi:ribonuclease D